MASDRVIDVSHYHESFQSFLDLIEGFSLEKFTKLLCGAKGEPLSSVVLDAPYWNPPKILCIGLNFKEHAADLGAAHPRDEPASFFKPRTTIIGPNQPIILPKQSKAITAEAELAVIVGRRCKDISPEEAPDHIFGYTIALDMTAEDILQRNPRFLTRSKSFDTFLSIGPWLVTPDEISEISKLRISTVLNGKVARSNVVANMTFSPYEIISFHSEVMTFEAGDIICTGTPGAARISPGDVVEGRIDILGSLVNPVLGPRA